MFIYETGMALSNELIGERVAGSVGKPMPFVSCRIMDEHGRECSAGVSGELRIKVTNCNALIVIHC